MMSDAPKRSGDFTHTLTDKVVGWGAGDAMAKTLDSTLAKLTIPKTQSALAQAGINAENLAKVTHANPMGYSELFSLGRESLKLGDLGTPKLSWGSYIDTVKNNIDPAKTLVEMGGKQGYLNKVFSSQNLKEVLITNNVEPIKEMLKGNKEALGSGLFRLGAFGLIGIDIFKHVKETYDHNRAKEDGSLSSQMKTIGDTVGSFFKYAFRAAATWEVAGIGMAIGRVLLPFAVGPISIGGILFGAVAGILFQYGLDKALKTGNDDPVAQEKAQLEKMKKLVAQTQGNPFAKQSA